MIDFNFLIFNSFNEAEALKPRILPGDICHHLIGRRFNEAEALKPRIPPGGEIMSIIKPVLQ